MSKAPPIERLILLNPDALLLEPRALYDPCVVDITDDPRDCWPRTKGIWVAVYDSELCVTHWMQDHETDWGSAEEWFYYNTAGAYVGPGTPTFTHHEDHGEE